MTIELTFEKFNQCIALIGSQKRTSKGAATRTATATSHAYSKRITFTWP